MSGFPDAPERDINEVFRELKSSWIIGEDSRHIPRMRGVRAQGSGADYRYTNATHFYKGIERARDYEQNNMVVGQAIRRLANSVFCESMLPDPDTGDDGTNKRIFDRWTAWANDKHACDVRGMLTFDRMAKLVFRSVIRDGDMLASPTKSGHLQCFEAHRIRSPKGLKGDAKNTNMVHGVEIDPLTARPIRYWVTQEEPERKEQFASLDAYDDQGIPATFHVLNPARLSQTRGITALLPITYPVGMHDDLQFANMVRAKIAACYAVIRELPESTLNTGGAPQQGSRTTETEADGSTTTVEETKPGVVITGRPGEKLHGFSPNVPNPEFFPHTMLILSFIAVNLDIPRMMLLLDPTETNYSGWRGAMDQAQRGWRDMQEWMIEFFFDPVYRWRIRVAVAEDAKLRGRAADPAIYRHRWKKPRWPYIEPLKDAQAYALRLNERLSSPRRIAGERGEDWEEIQAEIVADNSLLYESAMTEAEAINKRHVDAKLDWRELIRLDTAETALQADAALDQIDATPAQPKGKPK